jgi:hypothetical protein
MSTPIVCEDGPVQTGENSEMVSPFQHKKQPRNRRRGFRNSRRIRICKTGRGN